MSKKYFGTSYAYPKRRQAGKDIFVPSDRFESNNIIKIGIFTNCVSCIVMPVSYTLVIILQRKRALV